MKSSFLVGISGPPKSGKSTLFKRLVTTKNKNSIKNIISGSYVFNNTTFILLDEKKEQTTSFYKDIDCLLFVCTPLQLTESITLILQILEKKKIVILIINFIDIALKKEILLNQPGLIRDLQIPVVFTSAFNNIGITQLKTTIFNTLSNPSLYNTSNINHSYLNLQEHSFNDYISIATQIINNNVYY